MVEARRDLTIDDSQKQIQSRSSEAAKGKRPGDGRGESLAKERGRGHDQDRHFQLTGKATDVSHQPSPSRKAEKCNFAPDNQAKLSDAHLPRLQPRSKHRQTTPVPYHEWHIQG